ncbi:MAG: hypothetical protein KIS81_00465 [Maricaulaceae bacterium]|nr:hypothetical protein [Maricaulaceae bacterium]
MSWFDKILNAVQSAAVIGERVEKLGAAVADLAREQRDMDRRLSRLEGAEQARKAGGKA